MGIELDVAFAAEVGVEGVNPCRSSGSNEVLAELRLEC